MILFEGRVINNPEFWGGLLSKGNMVVILL
jgi:hypothetical protein